MELSSPRKDVHVEEAITVAAAPRAVLGALRDPSSVVRLVQNVSEVRFSTTSPFEEGSTYERVFSSHGIRNPQRVVVRRMVEDRTFETVTQLLGCEVVYSYSLEQVENGTRILLTKKASVPWWAATWGGLVRHLLTRPEHDGDHLERIKREVESAGEG